jgi:hypothetical protein
LLDQLRRGFRPDPRHSWNVVDAVAHESQHFAELLGRDPELLDHIIAADAPVVHGVEHVEPRLDQLHQVLVRRDDGDLPAGLERGL